MANSSVRCCAALYIASILLALAKPISSDLDPVYKLCNFDGCHNLSQSDVKYSGSDYNRKLRKLFSSGVGQLIYEDVDAVLSSSSSVSKACADQLVATSNALDSGREWAYRFIDASGKTPPAFLEGTVTSLGDYDECLAIRGPSGDGGVVGQYCLVDVFPVAYKSRPKNLDSGQVSLLTPQHFNASAYYFGLCFPSTCSNSDVRRLVKTVLEPFPLLVEGDIHCDTEESISYLTHLKNIRIGPVLSLAYLITVIGSVIWGTAFHVLRREKATDLQKSFSALENVHKLFYVAPGAPERISVFDWIKTISIASSIGAHTISCLETAIGWYLLSHHRNLKAMNSDPALAAMFNEAGIGVLTFLGGAAFFMVAYPLAMKGRLHFFPALLDRVLRHLPGVVTIVALDFVWYLWASGPFYTRVGQYTLNKCSQNWWANFLFISNLIGPAIEVCAGQTYFSSADVQLFVLGFFAIVLLVSRPKLGLAYCAAQIVASTGLLYYYMVKFELTPLLLVPKNADFVKIEQFLTYIHMSTSGLIGSYFSALLVCYTIELGWWRRFSRKVNHFAWVGFIFSMHQFQQNLPILTNTLDWVPSEWNAFYMFFVRFVVIVEMSAVVVYLSLFDFKDMDALNFQSRLQGDGKDIAPGYYSIPKAIIRLSFSVYFSNYYFIRTDFYTQRSLFHNSLFGLVKRIVSSTFFVVLWAVFFQVVFLGPFTNLRVMLMSRLIAKKSSVKKEN